MSCSGREGSKGSKKGERKSGLVVVKEKEGDKCQCLQTGHIELIEALAYCHQKPGASLAFLCIHRAVSSL